MHLKRRARTHAWTLGLPHGVQLKRRPVGQRSASVRGQRDLASGEQPDGVVDKSKPWFQVPCLDHVHLLRGVAQTMRAVSASVGGEEDRRVELAEQRFDLRNGWERGIAAPRPKADARADRVASASTRSGERRRCVMGGRRPAGRACPYCSATRTRVPPHRTPALVCNDRPDALYALGPLPPARKP